MLLLFSCSVGETNTVQTVLSSFLVSFILSMWSKMTIGATESSGSGLGSGSQLRTTHIHARRHKLGCSIIIFNKAISSHQQQREKILTNQNCDMLMW